MGSYNSDEDVYLPLTSARSLKMEHDGSTECWGNSGGDPDHLETVNCTWLQFWVQLDTPISVADYRHFLEHYSQDQRAAGRFLRAPNVRLRDLMQWLDHIEVVPGDTRLQVWLSIGFLAVCLINTVGLMLAKFMRRSTELSVRRALGASQRALFGQLLMESGVIGLLGGVGGVPLALLGLWLIRQQPAEYAGLARMDVSMLLATLVIAIAASLIAGLLPAWRACRVAPALQLKGN
jgi:putative ABC transport system permease protein